MRNLLVAVVVLNATTLAAAAWATPSTNFWAPSHALQPYGVLHVTYDTYFGSRAAYPIDAGLEIGVLSSKKVQAELGFDFFYPTFSSDGPVGAPILLNAKIGSPEGALFEGSPGWSLGVFGSGFEPDVTDYHVLHALLGKTFPLGTLTAGGYYGLNEELFRSSDGEESRSGLIAGWFSPAVDVPYIDHVNFVWDIQSGENVYGATGGGIYLYLTPTVDLVTGPVFFFDPDLQPGGADWMWSVQLDADISFLSR